MTDLSLAEKVEGLDGPASPSPRLTPKMLAVLDVLNELPEDMNYMSFKGIALHSFGRIQLCDVRRTTRHLWRKGLVEFGRGLWTDDGTLAGSGYCITPAGRAAFLRAKGEQNGNA